VPIAADNFIVEVFPVMSEVFCVLAGDRHRRASAFTPHNLEHTPATLRSECIIDQVCNGIVHPVTKETITKYEKLANDPLMKGVWTKAMCKELGRLAQGYGNKEGTNTIFFMTIEEIKQIPKDRTVTYACIVVDYRPQKNDPNRVRITVGGNLIQTYFQTSTIHPRRR
jgi:hypothetical protein